MSEHPEPPDRPLEAWTSTEREPWCLRRAGRLLRRAAFGARPKQLADALEAGPEKTVDVLLDYDPTVDPFNEMLERLEGFVNLNDLRSVQSWWLYRMLNTTRPVQERMALLWHNHFATSGLKVESGPLMHGQIELFRRAGLGSFRELVIAVGRDPAMLIWLDGRHSRKGKPNENYARELMELFTLGVGNYTEQDVRELSRCFTGWRIEGNRSRRFDKEWDDGEKTVLGRKGRFDDGQAVDVLLAQPAAARFLARRLLREFVHPTPPTALEEALAQRVVKLDWQLKPIVRELLLSRVFFSDYAYRARIKSLVELAVGTALALGGKVNTDYLRDMIGRMGQSLLFPPNVKGWDGERSWINANTVLVRFNLGMVLATQRGRREFVRRNDLDEYLREHELSAAEPIVEHFARLLLDGEIDATLREKLVDYMQRNEKNEPAPFKLSAGTVNSKIRGMLHLMMSTPQFQLC